MYICFVNCMFKQMNLFKSFYFTLLSVIFSISIHAQATWQQQANFPGAGRYWCSSFTIGDKIYVGLGYSPNGGSGGASVFYSDFYEYNTTTNTWTQRPSYPGAGRLYVTGFSINGKGYFSCGWYNGYQKDLWEYDPVANGWTQKASVPGPGRWGAVGFSIGNYGYVVTGDTQGNGQGCINGAYRYDQTSNLWMQIPDFPGTAVYGAAGFSIGNKGYVGTGYDGSVSHDEFYCWNEETYSWSQMADFGGAPRYQNVGFAIGNRGYIGLGSNGTGDMWEYNPSSNSWVQTLTYPGPGVNVNAAAATSTHAYVGLGQTANQQWWKYTPLDCSASVASIEADGPTEFCTGGSVGLTASSGSSYLWSNGSTNPAITVFESGNYSVAVNYSDGCVSSSSVFVNVNSTPLIEASASQTSLCVGEEVVFSASGADEYVWTPAIVQDVPFEVGLNSPTFYTVTAIDANGCTGTDEISIEIHPNPTLILSVSNAELCEGDSISITATGGLNYSWSPLIQNGLPFAPISSGYYSVIGTNEFACAAEDSIYITVNERPSVELNFVEQAQYCVGSGNIELFEGLPAGGIYSGFGVENNSIITDNAGIYEVTYSVINENGCSNFSVDFITVDNCTSIDSDPNSSLVVFPNPISSGECITVFSPMQVDGIQVFDLLGKQLSASVLQISPNQFEIMGLKAGIYVVYILQGEASQTRKIVVN